MAFLAAGALEELAALVGGEVGEMLLAQEATVEQVLMNNPEAWQAARAQLGDELFRQFAVNQEAASILENRITGAGTAAFSLLAGGGVGALMTDLDTDMTVTPVPKRNRESETAEDSDSAPRRDFRVS